MLHAEANKPFNLEQGPLSRLHLFRRKDRDVVLLQFHHIVADAASIAILLDEVIERYFALQAGLALPPSGQLTPFGQFVAWQRKQVDGAEGERHRNYWRQVLAGAPPSFLLPTDKQRSANPLGPGAACNFAMKGVVVEELKGLARAEGTTLFSVLLAAFNVLLHHHTGATDIVVGTPMSGRTRAEFERMVGYLVNAMPIRTQISADQPFVTVLAAADASVRSAIEHQDYPFPMIVHDIDPPRESGFSPIFQIMFGMERFHSTDPRGLAATLLNMAGPAIRYREYTVEFSCRRSQSCAVRHHIYNRRVRWTDFRGGRLSVRPLEGRDHRPVSRTLPGNRPPDRCLSLAQGLRLHSGAASAKTHNGP